LPSAAPGVVGTRRRGPRQRGPHARAARALPRTSRARHPPADARRDPGSALRTPHAAAAHRRDLGGFLRRLKVRVRARGVVGNVDHLGDLWHRRLDRDLDPLPKRDVNLATTLAATTQLHIRGTTANLEQVDEATMRSHRGIDLPIEYLLDARRNGVAPAFVRVVDPQRPAKGRGVEIDDGPLEVGGTARL